MSPDRETHLRKLCESLKNLTSEFMELGKGTWTDKDKDLIGLREQFFRYMGSYDRILSLRRLRSTRTYPWHYELVEIPKSLLLEARNGLLRVIHKSI
jgi:Type II site-specific deoxyribonuclease